MLTLPIDLTDTHALNDPQGDGLMNRSQAANFIVLDRPLLGQMAIATVLVGSAAALSSAGIAVPVSNVGFAKGWDERVPAAPRSVPSALAAEASPGLRASAPLLQLAPARVSTPTLRVNLVVPRTAGAELSAPMTRIVSTPALAELPLPQPVEAPVAEMAILPAPVAAPSAAPANLAASAAVQVSEVALSGEEALPAPAAAPLRLINPPELRGFDLARISGPLKTVPAGFARPAAKSAASGKVEGLGKKDTVVGDAVYHQVTVMVAGSDGKSVDVRIGADMKPSVKVGDLLGLVSDRMDPDSAARFAAASSAGDYVSLATLRSAGFDVSYNAGADSISISVAQ